MVDTLDLKSSGCINRAGSIPARGTINFQKVFHKKIAQPALFYFNFFIPQIVIPGPAVSLVAISVVGTRNPILINQSLKNLQFDLITQSAS